MVAGQVVDMESQQRGLARVEDLEAVHRRKTGRLLTCALTLGGRIARAKPEQLSLLQDYGQRIGLAFQIVDDLLDVAGDPARLGKGVRKDAELGKLTYPGLLGVEESRRQAAQLVDEACNIAARFGPRGCTLIDIARFVGQRDH